MRPGGILAAVWTVLALIPPRPAPAASCCGGGSAADAFALPEARSAALGASLGHEWIDDARGDDGRRIRPEDYAIHETRLILGGALRLGEDLQIGLSAPLVRREVRAGESAAVGAGLGDVGWQARYEIWAIPTCGDDLLPNLRWNDLSPSLHAVLRGEGPTGRAPGEAGDPLGADILGRGMTVIDAGLESTKLWSRLATHLRATAGYQWPGSHTYHPPAWRWEAAGSLLYYPSFRRFGGLSITHRQERQEETEPGWTQRRYEDTSLGAVLAWIAEDNTAWGRLTVAEHGRLQGRNNFLSWQATLAAGWYID